MSTWPPQDEVGAHLLADLREEASDRPAHAAFLAQLEQVGSEGLAAGKSESDIWEALEDLPVPRGVSARVAEAMVTDVDWIVSWVIRPRDDESKRRSRYERAYANRRSTDAGAAQQRERTRERSALSRMINLPLKGDAPEG